MFTITTALAEQRRREMLAQADAARTAHRAVTRNTKRTAQGALVLAATAAIASSLVGLASAQATTPTNRAAITRVHTLAAQHKIGPRAGRPAQYGIHHDPSAQGRPHAGPTLTALRKIGPRAGRPAQYGVHHDPSAQGRPHADAL